MRIGVITFSDSKDNYGQLLQCYAMQRYLSRRGHTPFLIRYKDTPIEDTTGFKLHKFGTYLLRLPQYVKWYFNREKERKQVREYLSSADFVKRDFDGFLSKHIQCSEIYTHETIHTNPPVADAYICGSDQIWAGDDAYYLSFAPDDALKIAYAPSLGGMNTFPAEKEARMKRLIGRIDRVGMREQSGVETCRRLGRIDAVKVVDPTLLLDGRDYLEIAASCKTNKPYAFVYMLGNPVDVPIDDIFKANRGKGLETIYVASQGRSDNMPKIDPTIEEWLGLMANANMIVTNSFHCVVFALQFHKNFISIPLSGGYERMNTRTVELLKECSLSERITTSLTDIPTLSEVDFEVFERYKRKQQAFSSAFLEL